MQARHGGRTCGKETMKVTRETLNGYRKTKRLVPILQTELEEMEKGDVEKLIRTRRKKLQEKKKQIEAMDDWINSIEDDQTRIVFDLYYRKGKTWKQIAAHLGGVYSEDYIRLHIRDKYMRKTGIR